jgi:hypothetical protein
MINITYSGIKAAYLLARFCSYWLSLSTVPMLFRVLD